MQWGTMPDMKRVATALICGVFLTAMIFRGPLHRDALVSWKDKPIMPNVFTYFLLPGYNLAAAIPPPLALSPRHGDNVRLHLVQHSSMAGAPIQVLAGRRIGLGPSKQFASQLS